MMDLYIEGEFYMQLFVKDKLKLCCYLAISFILSVLGVFFLPVYYELIFTKGSPKFIFMTALFILTVLIVLLILGCVCFKLKKVNSESSQGKFCFIKKILAVLSIFIGFAIIMSLLFGLTAVLFYQLTKNTFSLEQIKGILNYIISAVIVLILPLGVSVFWEVINSTNKIFVDIKNGISIKGEKYFALLISILVLFSVGILITTIFNYFDNTIIFKIVKMILFALTGTVGLLITEKICETK